MVRFNPVFKMRGWLIAGTLFGAAMGMVYSDGNGKLRTGRTSAEAFEAKARQDAIDIIGGAVCGCVLGMLAEGFGYFTRHVPQRRDGNRANQQSKQSRPNNV